MYFEWVPILNRIKFTLIIILLSQRSQSICQIEIIKFEICLRNKFQILQFKNWSEDFASLSALLLPRIPMWLGIQKKIVYFTLFRYMQVLFKHIKLNILSKGFGTSSQTYFALSLMQVITQCVKNVTDQYSYYVDCKLKRESLKIL